MAQLIAKRLFNFSRKEDAHELRTDRQRKNHADRST